MATNAERLMDAVADYGTEQRLGGSGLSLGIEVDVVPIFAVRVRVNGEIVAAGRRPYLDDAFGAVLRAFRDWRNDNDRLAQNLEASLDQIHGRSVANVNGVDHDLSH